MRTTWQSREPEPLLEAQRTRFRVSLDNLFLRHDVSNDNPVHIRKPPIQPVVVIRQSLVVISEDV